MGVLDEVKHAFGIYSKDVKQDTSSSDPTFSSGKKPSAAEEVKEEAVKSSSSHDGPASSNGITTNPEEAHAKPTLPALGSRSTTDTNVTTTTNGADDNASMIPLGKGQNTVGTSTPQPPLTETLGTSVLQEGNVSSDQDFAVREIERAALIREMENCEKGREGIHFSDKDEGAPDGRAEVETIIGRFPNIKSLTGSMRRISLTPSTRPAVEGDSAHSVPVSDEAAGTTRDVSAPLATNSDSALNPVSTSAANDGLTSLQREELNKVPDAESSVPATTTASAIPASRDNETTSATSDTKPAAASESPDFVTERTANLDINKNEPGNTSTEASPASAAAENRAASTDDVAAASPATQDRPLSRTPSKSGRRLSGLFRRGSKKTSGPSPSASTTDLNASTTSLVLPTSPAKAAAPGQATSTGPSAASAVRPRTPPFRSRRNTASEGSAAVAVPVSTAGTDAAAATETGTGPETAGSGTIASGTSHGADTVPHDSTTSADLGLHEGKTDSQAVPSSDPPSYQADRAAEGGEVSQAEKTAAAATASKDLSSVETGGVGPSTTASASTNGEPATRKRASSGLAGKLTQEIEERARAQREGRVYDGPGTWIKAPVPSEPQPAAESTPSTSITPSTSTRDIPASTAVTTAPQTGGSPYGSSPSALRASESSTSLNRPPSRSGGGLGGLFRRKSRRVSTSSVGGSTTNLKASESTASLIDPTSDAKPVTSSEGAVTGNVVDGTSEHATAPVEQHTAPAAAAELASKPTSVHDGSAQNGVIDTNDALAKEIEDRAAATEGHRPASTHTTDVKEPSIVAATEDQRPASTHTSDVKEPSLVAAEEPLVSEDKQVASESTETAVVPKETTSTETTEATRPPSTSISQQNTGSDAGLSRTPSKSGGGLGGLFRRRSRRLSKASLGGSTTNLNASTTSLGDGSGDNTEAANKPSAVSTVRPRTPPFRSRRNTLTESAPPAENKEAAAVAVAGNNAPLEREVAAAEPAGESTDVFAHSVPAQEAGLEPREVVAEPEVPSEAAVTTSTDDTVANGATALTTLKRSSSGLAFSLTQEIEERAKAAREGRDYSGPGSSMWIKPGVPTSTSESNLQSTEAARPASGAQGDETPVPQAEETESTQVPATASSVNLSDERQPDHTVPLAQTQSRADSVASASGASLTRSPSKTKSGIFGGLFRRRSKRLSTGSQPGSTTDLNASTTSLVDDNQAAGTEGAAVSTIRPRTPPFRSRRNTLTSTEDLPATGAAAEETAQPVEETPTEMVTNIEPTESHDSANTSTGMMTSPSGHFDDQYLPPVQEVSEAGSIHEEETDEAEHHPSPYNTLPGSASRASLAHLLSQEIEERAKAQREGREYTGRGSQIWLKTASTADLALPQGGTESQTAAPVTQPSAFHEDFESQNAGEQQDRADVSQDGYTPAQGDSTTSPVTAAKPADTQTKRKSGFFANLFRSRTKKEQPPAYRPESAVARDREPSVQDAGVQTQDGDSVRHAQDGGVDEGQSLAAQDHTYEEESVAAPEPVVDNRPIFEIACDTPLPAPTYTAKTQARLDRQRKKREYEEYVERERVRREEELLAKRERIMTAYTGRQDFSKVPTPSRTKPFGNKKELDVVQHIVKPDRASRRSEAAETGEVRSRGSSVSSAPYGSPVAAHHAKTPSVPGSPLSPTSPRLGVDAKLAQELPGANRHQHDNAAVPLSPRTDGSINTESKPVGESLRKKPSTKRKSVPRASTEIAEKTTTEEPKDETALKKKASTKRKSTAHPTAASTEASALQEPNDGVAQRKPSTKRKSASRPSTELTDRPQPIEMTQEEYKNKPSLNRKRSLKEKLLRQNEDGEEEQSNDMPDLTRKRSIKEKLLRQNED